MDNAQELIQRLNHSGKKLSKSHRRIAECIVTHYDKVVFMTASKLGEYVGVSESTVVRFAAALGYSGYPQLQKALQELIRHRLTASQRFEMTSDMDHAQVLNKVLKADIHNIRATLDELDINAFEDAIEKIIAARNIYVMGLRASAPIAEFFAHYLRFIFSNVHVVTSGVSDVFEQLARITDGDLLIGISFPRYTSRSIEAMEGEDRHVLLRGFLCGAPVPDQCADRGAGAAQAARGFAVLCGDGRDLEQIRRLPGQKCRQLRT